MKIFSKVDLPAPLEPIKVTISFEEIIFDKALVLCCSDASPLPFFLLDKSSTYVFKIHYEAIPTGLSGSNTTTYVSQYFGNGLLYACLVEAFMFLKGPTDMLTLYENRYKTELQKFAAMQVGRRRRDDYTDGTIRIPIESAPQ